MHMTTLFNYAPDASYLRMLAEQYEVAAATPGTAEFLSTLLVDAENGCGHESKLSKHNRMIPARLGFFSLMFGTRLTTVVETYKLCRHCYDKAVPEGFVTWTITYERHTDQMISMTEGEDLVVCSNLPSHDNDPTERIFFPPVAPIALVDFKAIVTGNFDIENAQIFYKWSPYIPQTIPSQCIWREIMDIKKPFYVDLMHLWPPRNPKLTCRKTIEDEKARILLQNSPAYLGASAVFLGTSDGGAGQNTIVEQRLASIGEYRLFEYNSRYILHNPTRSPSRSGFTPGRPGVALENRFEYRDRNWKRETTEDLQMHIDNICAQLRRDQIPDVAVILGIMTQYAARAGIAANDPLYAQLMEVPEEEEYRRKEEEHRKRHGRLIEDVLKERGINLETGVEEFSKVIPKVSSLSGKIIIVLTLAISITNTVLNIVFWVKLSAYDASETPLFELLGIAVSACLIFLKLLKLFISLKSRIFLLSLWLIESCLSVAVLSLHLLIQLAILPACWPCEIYSHYGEISRSSVMRYHWLIIGLDGLLCLILLVVLLLRKWFIPSKESFLNVPRQSSHVYIVDTIKYEPAWIPEADLWPERQLEELELAVRQGLTRRFSKPITVVEASIICRPPDRLAQASTLGGWQLLPYREQGPPVCLLPNIGTTNSAERRNETGYWWHWVSSYDGGPWQSSGSRSQATESIPLFDWSIEDYKSAGLSK